MALVTAIVAGTPRQQLNRRDTSLQPTRPRPNPYKSNFAGYTKTDSWNVLIHYQKNKGAIYKAEANNFAAPFLSYPDTFKEPK